ncbi:MAG: DUF3696 domain-containing protein [Cyanobacteria bacterium]|nr:DUF3696 domain-containing protein [Cyanobacteriota bacterium]
MLETLRFQNFKSWRDTGDIRLASITGLFGTNSSGKSSILQFLLMLKQTVESRDRQQVLELGSEQTYVDLGSTKDFLHKHKIPSVLNFKCSWKPSNKFRLPLSTTPILPQGSLISSVEYYQGKIHLSSSLGIQNNQLQVKSIEYSFVSKNDVKNSVGLNLDASNGKYELQANGDVLSNIAWKIEDFISPPFKIYGFSSGIYHQVDYIANLVESFENQILQVYYLGPLREYPHRLYIWSGETPQDVGKRGELTIPALLAANREGTYVEEQVAKWLKALGLIHDFSLQPIAENRREYELLIQRTPYSTKTTITDVGFGVSQILPVLVLCYYAPEGSTVIFEQPEIHLHPSVQADLADVFVEVAKERNLQIIVESHSEHLLRRLQRRIAEAEKITNEETALYFCDMDDNGESHLTPLALDEFGNINNWPAHFFGDEMGDLVAMTEAAMHRQMAGDAS